MSVSTLLQLLMGGGLIGGAWRASAVFRDVVTLLRDTSAALNSHVANHPGPGQLPATTQENTSAPA